MRTDLSINLIFINPIIGVIVGFPVYLPNRTCGIDNSPIAVVYEGVARIETYPWMGVLVYPYRRALLTTVVILVTKQTVISFALDIHKLPKRDFRYLEAEVLIQSCHLHISYLNIKRENSKVILGHNCSGPRIGVLDYNYHPEYKSGKHSALVLIQLNLSYVQQELRPICEPPDSFTQLQFHAMVLPEDCKSSKINIYEMIAVPPEDCRHYYRKSGLDIESIWPKYTACGRARWGGECVWRSGAALVVKQQDRWHLLGFGVHGPGCQAPSRFVDYGMYRRWVSTSVERIGRPAITRIERNHLIFRRSSNSLQRFGPCDVGEIKTEIYTDRIQIKWSGDDQNKGAISRSRYNVSIHSNFEYSCVVFRADYTSTNPQLSFVKKPLIRLTRYCVNPGPLCFGGGLIKVDFYVEIFFQHTVKFTIAAYGNEVKFADPRSLLLKANNKKRNLEMVWDNNYLPVLIW